MKLNSALCALLSALASAKEFNIEVGENGLSYTPSQITASKGDLVHFHFYPGGHSVAQSTYLKPCKPSGSKAIWSGFFYPSSGQASQMFTVTVKNKDPIWIYCAQSDHCPEGMAFVINPGKGESLAAYKKKASGLFSGVAPKKVQGGVIGPNKPGRN